MDERLTAIRIKATFFYTSLICAHAPTEDKNADVKDAYYARLEATYDHCPTHDVKILLGDFNAKIGQECIFHSTIGQCSLHESMTSNGHRLIDFVAARNMVIANTRFKHLNILKATWMSLVIRAQRQESNGMTGVS